MIESYFQTIFQIITTGHQITDQVNKELKAYGMTEPQYNVLKILKGAKGKPVTVQKILEDMVQRSSNVTRIVDKLLLKGYVDRKECSTNRRKMDISITNEGLIKLKELDKKVVNLHKPFMNNLNEEELNLLRKLILKLKSEGHD